MCKSKNNQLDAQRKSVIIRLKLQISKQVSYNYNKESGGLLLFFLYLCSRLANVGTKS